MQHSYEDTIAHLKLYYAKRMKINPQRISFYNRTIHYDDHAFHQPAHTRQRHHSYTIHEDTQPLYMLQVIFMFIQWSAAPQLVTGAAWQANDMCRSKLYERRPLRRSPASFPTLCRLIRSPQHYMNLQLRRI
eukprot:2163804-Amphidinium_carterae.1